MLHCPTCGSEYSGVEFCPKDNSPLQADATIAGAEAIDPLIGQTLDDKYLIEQLLGIGGMGTVYRARHLLIDRPVAIKVLNQRFAEDETVQARFRREAKAAGRLQHPNAVLVTDFGQTAGGYAYIVMELLEGSTLRDVLAKESPLETARAVSLMLQISGAVAAAHDAGIIHRDLKPANIFVVQRPDVPAAVKVLDFGIAKIAVETIDEDDPKTLTYMGAMIGTPRYMSPEQCIGKELTPAADVYSLGVILYEMLTGKMPFNGSTPLAIAVKHATQAPLRPREIISSIPAALEEVVLHALEKRPENRPADAAAFKSELYETAERLGLEHAETSSGPDMAALRNAGTQSPSGRLVIDISRLRENRAATSNINESTVLRPPLQAPPEVAVASRPQHPRVSVDLGQSPDRTTQKAIVLVGALLVVVLIIGATVFTVRSLGPAPVVESKVGPSPSPTVEPSPSPSPTPAQKRAAKKQADNTNKKGVVNRVKRFFKKAF